MLRAVKPASLFVLLAMGLTACSSGTNQQTYAASLFVTPSTRQINDTGQTVEIRVTAQDDQGKVGTGEVLLSATAGQFDNGMNEITVALNTQGSAVTVFRCVAAQDAGCKNAVRITGKWNDVTTSTSLLVGAVTGTPDAGTGGTDGGTGGTDGGTGSSTTQDGLTFTLDKQQVLSNTGDYVVATARLLDSSNKPVANEPIEFTADGAQLAPFAGGVSGANLTVRTDVEGVAQARVYGGQLGAIAQVKAKHNQSQLVLPLDVIVVQQISWKSTQCQGTDCTVMGIKGSGFHEQSLVTFVVTDALGRTVSNVLVTFEISNPPTGTTVSTEAVARADGTVVASLTSGPVPGAVTVRATVVGTSVTSESPTIGIRGAKPSNQGFILQCTPFNVGAYMSATPPADRDVTCQVQLVDRFNNPVGTGTSVNFKPEAGSMPNAIATGMYQASGSNKDEGSAAEVFSTLGRWPAVDVAPLPANPGQWPLPLMAEPSIKDGFFVRNPRDGLVTIIAYVRGEEYFQDNNANGVRDPGEMFIDQGEAFVDENDNNTWDPGEFYIDDSPADGKWNPPNGRWDSNTTIWTTAHVLYTDFPIDSKPYSALSPDPFATTCSEGVAKGESRKLAVKFADLNLNRPDGRDYELHADESLTVGNVSIDADIQDSYGFGISTLLVDASTQQECTAASNACNWKTIFTNWSEGVMNPLTLKGDDLGNAMVCSEATVSVTFGNKPGLPNRSATVTAHGFFQ